MERNILLIFAIGLAAVVIVVVAIRNRMTPAGVVAEPAAPLSIRITRVISLLWAAIAAIGTAIALYGSLLSDRVTVRMPVAAFWPEAYPTADVQGPEATVVGGAGFSFADVEVQGLDVAARLWLSAGHLALGISTVAIALTVNTLCNQLLKREPFRVVLSAPVNATALAVMVGGLAWQFCFGMAGSLASNQVLGSGGWGFEPESVAAALDIDMPVIGIPDSTTNITIDFWPIAVGLALFALATAFRHSERLQRETEGLV